MNGEKAIWEFCPECGETARRVWESEDGKTIGVRCSRAHLYGKTELRDVGHYQKKITPRRVKNLVFLVPLNECVLRR